jgi:hypothetical protein
VKPSHVKIYDACAFVRLFMLNEFSVMIIIIIIFERKTKSEYKHLKWRTFNFVACKCNNTQIIFLWIHNLLTS